MQQKDDMFIPAPRRRWTFCPVLDRYMFQEFMIPFTVLILGFVLMFVIADIYDSIKDFLDSDMSNFLIVKYFILKLPGHVEFILPLSILLACMYMMANMGKNLEIIAMRASGISIHRACASIYFIAVIITFVDFMFKETIVPVSEKEAYILLKMAQRGVYDFNLKEMLSYRSPDSTKMWFFKYFDLDGVQKDVILKKYRPNGTLDWDIIAKEAEFINGKGWEFRNATLTTYDEEGLMPNRPQKMNLIMKGIDEFPETPKDIMNQIRPPDELSTLVIFDLLSKTKNMAKSSECLYETTLYKRFAFPWACVIVVFLGIPLAAKNERSGIFMAIIASVVIILAYTVISQFMLILGNRGIIPPAIAGLGPTLAFLAYGFYNIRHNN